LKPGDLLSIRKWNISYAVPVEYVEVWDRPDGNDTRQSTWEHGEMGLLLDGRYELDDLVLVEVLLRGEKWWVLEDEIEVVRDQRDR